MIGCTFNAKNTPPYYPTTQPKPCGAGVGEKIYEIEKENF
jgi:hypothetical protein